MNKYSAFYRGRQIEVEAETSYLAQKQAAKNFKVNKTWEVSIILIGKVEEDGKVTPVTHLPLM